MPISPSESTAMKKLLLSGIAALFLATGTHANASDIKLVHLPPIPGTVVNYESWHLEIVGDIAPGDDLKFVLERRKIPLPYRDALNVYLKGRGGNLEAGLNIGKMIAGFEMGTFVEEYCASVCALMWLAGGSNRAVWDTAHIGFHAAYYGENGTVTPEGNALVGAYLHSLGFNDEAIVFLTQKQPDSMEWLTSEKAK